jgi:CxxC motif-containing protein (DUF1111 family)
MQRSRSARNLLIVVTTGFLASFTLAVQGQTGATEAPAAFDNLTNGFTSQAQFDLDRATFEERDEIDEGLGPVYNAQSCAECHQTPVTGSSSQVAELRAGHRDGAGNFVAAPGGSLINDRAINADIQERVPGAEDVRTLRMSTTVLGTGFIEAIDSNTLIAIANEQATQTGDGIAGQVIQVPVLEAPGETRVGRFGWKNQNSSLLSFAADAYLNEMGITNRLQLTENTSMGRSVAAFDEVPDNAPCVANTRVNCGEDPEGDIDIFARFMRATKAPPRDMVVAITAASQSGEILFNQIGCDTCHRPSITTAPAGALINGGTFRVPAALGNKIIHPYSDFLLHNIGTGDGIVQNGGQSTANKIRTMPLWGTRTRDRHMHDGLSLTFTDAILRHGGEATSTINTFRALSATQRSQIVTFLQSL